MWSIVFDHCPSSHLACRQVVQNPVEIFQRTCVLRVDLRVHSPLDTSSMDLRQDQTVGPRDPRISISLDTRAKLLISKVGFTTEYPGCAWTPSGARQERAVCVAMGCPAKSADHLTPMPSVTLRHSAARSTFVVLKT